MTNELKIISSKSRRP